MKKDLRLSEGARDRFDITVFSDYFVSSTLRGSLEEFGQFESLAPVESDYLD